MTFPVPPGAPLQTNVVAQDEFTGGDPIISSTQAGQAAAITQAARQQAAAQAAAEAGPALNAMDDWERRKVAGKFEGLDPNSQLARTERQLRQVGQYHLSQELAAPLQFGRGVVDAILAPGALVGMASEAAGTAVGSEWMRDFGRELGQASSGRGYFETLAEVFDDAPMEAGTRRDTAASRAAKVIKQQDQDYPLLSMISRAAGQAAVAAAAGIATAAPSAATFGVIGALEGAAGGAQSAYQVDKAPLVDVLSSSLLGAALGAGTGYGAARLGQYASSKMPKLSEIGESLGNEATRQARNAAATVDEVGGIQGKRVLDQIMDAKNSIAKAIKSAGPNPSMREAAEAAARSDVAQKIMDKVSGNAAKWATREPDALEKFFRRPEYLNTISRELSDDFANVAAHRPSLDFDFDSGVARKLMSDADAPLAIGKVQSRLTEVAKDLPDRPELAELAMKMHQSAVTLSKGARASSSKRAYADGAATAMQEGHSVVRELNRLAASPDETIRAFAQKARGELVEDLSSDAFGSAGSLYRRAHIDSDPLEALADPAALRDRLRTMKLQGEVLEQVEARNRSWVEAFEARKAFSGSKASEAAEVSMRNLGKRVAAAERALTLDGKAPGGLLDKLGALAGRGAANVVDNPIAGAVNLSPGEIIVNKLIGTSLGHMIGGVPGAMLGFAVSNTVGPYVTRAMTPYIETGTRYAVKSAAPAAGMAIGSWFRGGQVGAGDTASQLIQKAKGEPAPKFERPKRPTVEERQELYKERVDMLKEFSPELSERTATDGLLYIHEAGPETTQEVAAAMNQRVSQLMQDIPRPQPNIGGPAYEVLSMQDLQRSEAMWDATFEPMGLFDDFERGVVNYERIEYTWKQYPGLQRAVQAGIIDTMQAQMSDEQRTKIPSNMVAQLDYLAGFNGELHTVNDPEFSGTITKLNEKAAEQNKKRSQQQRPPSASPIAKHQRSYTDRLMNR